MTDPDVPYIEHTLAGGGGVVLRLAKPTPRVRRRLLGNAHAWAKERTADNLRLAGIDGEDMLPRLAEFDEKPPTVGEFIDYINAGNGPFDVLEQALGAEKDPAAAADAIGDGERLELVCRLCEAMGIRLSPSAGPAETDEGEEPNPPTPAATT